MVYIKTFTEPPFRENEIFRYAQMKEADEGSLALLKECLEEVRGKLSYQVCFLPLSVEIKGDVCDFGIFSLQSEKLAKFFSCQRETVLFAATVGAEIDRLILKYSRISPAKALFFGAIGAERIEALADAFSMEMGMSSRFSPGYGDLPLSAQTEIFRFLLPQKHIGLCLNESLLMSPTKSVTAFLGKNRKNSCTDCDKKDCAFRGEQ